MANTPNLWGMFVSAGYLTVVKAIDPKKEKFRIAIPNYEVRRYFIRLTEHQLGIDNLIAENKNDFFKNYQNVLMIPSYHDLNNENSYHMMMLGMCLCLSDNYKVLFIIEKKVKEDVISLSRLMMKRKHRVLLNLSIG